MSVNIKVTGGLNIEWGQIDPKATGGLIEPWCMSRDAYFTGGNITAALQMKNGEVADAA